MRRNLLVGLVVGGVVAVSAAGWVLASQIRSPAELAAEAAPPPASNITVEVVRQVLSADVITRGEVVYDEPIQLSLGGSFADQPERLVVTAVTEVDAELVEGDLAIEVVGRPVFVLEGDIPSFRDLRPGASGVDVLQLEQALSRLGHLPRTPRETFDAETGAAVAAWYRDQGYVPNGPSSDDEAALRAARERVRDLETAVADTTEAGRAEELQARSEVDAAVAALELAELDAERAARQTRRAVETASAVRDEAEARQQQAEQGQHPDTGQAPTTSELAQLRREAADAAAALDDARFDVDRSAKEHATSVAQARDRVAIARVVLEDLRAGAGGDVAAAAAEELEAARGELAELEATVGTWLPAGEFVFLPRLPVRVDQVSVARGSAVEGSFLTVSGSQLALRTSVLERDAGLLSVGMEVEIEDPAGGAPIRGIVSEVADRPGTHNLAGDRVYVEVEPDELPSELIGQNVRVTIPVSSTAGEVLAVPAAALSATATGSTIVQVEDADGSLRTVEVEPGLATGGLVEVTPVAGELSEGDLVVVGRDDGSALDIDEVGGDDTDGRGPPPDPGDEEPAEEEPAADEDG